MLHKVITQIGIDTLREAQKNTVIHGNFDITNNIETHKREIITDNPSNLFSLGISVGIIKLEKNLKNEVQK